MNEKFDFNRFWTYFKYDVVQLWRNHGRALLLIGGFGLVLYVVHVLGSLVFAPHAWTAPQFVTRMVFLSLSVFALQLYQTRTYGYLTEKHAGTSWLMIPASTAEKVTSMSLITLILQPVAFAIVYLGIDALICALDPTAGTSIAGVFSGHGDEFTEAFFEMKESGVSLIWFFLAGILGGFVSLTYYLLCGICFKKWKIVGAFAIIFALELVLVMVAGGLAGTGFFQNYVDFMESPSADAAVHYVNGFMAIATLFTFLVWVLLVGGVAYRVKTLKH